MIESTELSDEDIAAAFAAAGESLDQIHRKVLVEEDARQKVTFSEILPLIRSGETVALVFRRNHCDEKRYCRLDSCSNFRGWIQFYSVPDCRWRWDATSIWPEWFTDLKCWRPLTEFERAYKSDDFVSESH